MKVKIMASDRANGLSQLTSPMENGVWPRLARLTKLARLSLSLVPTVMGLLGVLLAAVLAYWDPVSYGGEPAWWHFVGDRQDAANLLSTLLGALVTIASLVFAITMVVLTLAAGQLGPRLIRSFIEDIRTKAVLDWFLLTILYLLAILHALRIGPSFRQMPQSAVAFGLSLWGSCIFVMLFYVDHLARSIIADTIIARTGADLDKGIDEVPKPEAEAALDASLFSRRGRRVLFPARRRLCPGDRLSRTRRNGGQA